ncbi:hypothetical protein GLOIN_2v1475812 [Rhizophagus clarus]|uniref:DNA-directed DNA polymerase n=1 Tax=Rhizophagus clarus TaxID=94130 RepID=A0A8H3LZN0_9GLOM|nr:hypothetical protein GLOIN_2v1475812 [Rhizophagus clarus]
MQKKYLKKILKAKPNAQHGYFLNIKSHFPLKTHDYLRDLPPAVKNVAVGKDWLSPYNKELVNNLDGGRFSKTEKLVPHLGPRKDYIIHYLELQYYVKLGMVVDEVSEIFSFDQTNWLTPYIAFNTEKRQGAKNTFEKDFFKLMNNSVYSKTMENVRKYWDVKLIKMNNEQDEKAFLKKVSSPKFKYGHPLRDTLVGAHMGKASVTLNKLIIVGASVLGLSKLHMYRFWLFKDETTGSVITESFHINSKLYHYVLADKSTNSRHKGVSKKGMEEMAIDTYMPNLEGSLLDEPIDKSSLSEQEAKDLAMRTEADPITLVYRDCLFGKEVFHAKNVGIRSKDHILSLVESEKKALSPINTKDWILSDRITTLPYFHWRNMIYKNMVKDGIPHEEAKKRAIRTKLPEKYLNECVSHISSLQL